MRDIWNVFYFTLRDAIRKKSFLISTIIVLAAIVVACSIPMLRGEQDADSQPVVPDDTERSKLCYVIDEAALIPGGAEALRQAITDTRFVEGSLENLEQYKAEVQENKERSIVLLTGQDGVPLITVFTADFMSGISADTVKSTLKSVYLSYLLQEEGVDPALAETILSDLPLTMEFAGKMDLSGYVVGILLTMLVFFTVYFYGIGVANSIATEKTSRVMETLVVATKPRNILIGKCLGMGAVGLIQLSSFLLVGSLCYHFMVPDEFTIMGMPLALSSFTVSSALLILLYFLLGYALYAVLNAVCGASVSRIEDVNSALMPVVLLSLVSFYCAYAVIFMNSEGLKRVVTYLPFSSPFIMPFRLLNDTVTPGEAAISLLLLVAAILVVAMISIKIYNNSILHYGKKLKWKDAYRANR